MINAYNLTEQELAQGEFITFSGFNFGCNKFCNGDQNSLTITRTGTYEITVSVNASPTVAGQMRFDLTRNSTVIPGGSIYLPGTTVDIIENGSTKVVVNAFAGTSFGVRNSTETNPVTVPAQGASIVIRRLA